VRQRRIIIHLKQGRLGGLGLDGRSGGGGGSVVVEGWGDGRLPQDE